MLTIHIQADSLSELREKLRMALGDAMPYTGGPAIPLGHPQRQDTPPAILDALGGAAEAPHANGTNGNSGVPPPSVPQEQGGVVQPDKPRRGRPPKPRPEATEPQPGAPPPAEQQPGAPPPAEQQEAAERDMSQAEENAAEDAEAAQEAAADAAEPELTEQEMRAMLNRYGAHHSGKVAAVVALLVQHGGQKRLGDVPKDKWRVIYDDAAQFLKTIKVDV